MKPAVTFVERNGKTHILVLFPDGRRAIYEVGTNVGFGGGFAPSTLIRNGVISFILVRLLGATLPGAVVMAIGSILWEGGSVAIPAGWKRYVLGLFSKPE